MARKPRAGRDPKKEAVTDEIYNARRRAKRALARLDRDIKSGKVKRSRHITAYRKEIEAQIAATYQGRKPNQDKVAQAQKSATTLDRYRVGAKAQATERRNIMFKANVKAGSAGSGTLPKENIAIFWNATKSAWAGRGGDRYAALQRYYGMDDLQKIFEMVMAENKDALARAKGLNGSSSITDTSDPASALQQAMGEGVEADGNYPNDYMAYVVPVYATQN